MEEYKTLNPCWLTIKAGKLLADAEKQVLDDILPNLYGYHLVQCAPPIFASFTSTSLISHKIMVNEVGYSNWPCSLVRGNCETLGLQNDSVDVVLLTHTLELAQRPHQVLREAHRVLIPEGHVVLTGINPFSLWGLVILIKKLFNRSLPMKMMSPRRVKDWLHLLGFEITEVEMFAFRPPLAHKKIMSKLLFLEKLGSKLWPIFGGGYAIVGCKKVVTLTAVKPKFVKKAKIWAGAEGVSGAGFKRDDAS